MCWGGSPVGVGEDEAGGRERGDGSWGAVGPPNHARKGRGGKADHPQPWSCGKSNDDDEA
jgi:hypothetical protein